MTSSPLLDWILGSFVAYGLATNALWLARMAWRRWARARRDSYSPPAFGRLSLLGRGGQKGLCEAGRFVFYVGIPYLALGGWPRQPLQGVLTLQDMGWAGLGGEWTVGRWLGAVGTGAGLGAIALVGLLVAWSTANRPAAGLRLRFPSRPWWALLIDVIYLAIHWAFYRAALAVLLGDVYTAAFASVALVYVEWAVSPFWRAGWRQEGRAAAQWLRMALALAMALLYLLTRNLWVCLGVQLAVEGVFWRIGRSRETNLTLTVSSP